MPLFLRFLIFNMHSHIHKSFTIRRGPSSCILIASLFSKRNLHGVPRRDLNSGLSCSKPMDYQRGHANGLRRTLLSYAAPLLSYIRTLLSYAALLLSFVRTLLSYATPLLSYVRTLLSYAAPCSHSPRVLQCKVSSAKTRTY
jgi:hypothetical protein